MNEQIVPTLFEHQDIAYRDFQAKLIPTVDPETMIGVRTPALRQMAKEMYRQYTKGSGSVTGFLSDLPHHYFEENQLHAFIISEIKEYDACMKAVNTFLPYVDNWATCDQMSPKVFKKHHRQLTDQIKNWLKGDTYSIRFAIKMLMDHFLDDNFDAQYPAIVAQIRSDEYYINMMIAWYFATALAKQYESILPFIEERRLDTWTHNKSIQKAVESRRITDAQKEYLRKLKTV